MTTSAVLGLLLALGCQANKSTPEAKPTGATSPAGDAAAGSAQATALAAPPVAPAHVMLPRSPDTPPHRTTRPLDTKELARLSAFEFKDFQRQDRGTTGQSIEFRHTTATRPILGVTVTIEPCGHPPTPPTAPDAATTPRAQHACTAMELGAWQARRDELEQSLPPDLAARPDTRFEIGTRDIAGTLAIYTYQLGSFFGTDQRGQPVGAYSDAYILYYNDGVNQIRVNAAYLDDAVGDIDHLLAIAPPEDLEKLAVAFLGFYVHEWK